MKRTSSEELCGALGLLNIEKNKTYIIHSSLFSFGLIEDGCKGVMQCLESVLGSEATIIMPTFTFSYANSRQWICNSTKSETGVLTEYFRNLNYTARTIHPFHSLSVSGPNSKLYTSCTNLSSFGPNSPFEVLIRENAINIGLGIGLVGGATFLHYTEEFSQVPYRYYKEFLGMVIDQDGNIMKDSYSMYVRKINEQSEYENDWEWIDRDLIKEGIYKKIILKGAEIFTMNTRLAHEFFLGKILENPYYCSRKVIKKGRMNK